MSSIHDSPGSFTLEPVGLVKTKPWRSIGLKSKQEVQVEYKLRNLVIALIQKKIIFNITKIYLIFVIYMYIYIYIYVCIGIARLRLLISIVFDWMPT